MGKRGEKMNFIKKLKWLFKDAPTCLKEDKEERTCTYCRRTNDYWHFKGTGLVLCAHCFKRLCDKVLK